MCRLCGVGTESVYHVACECRDARLAAVQQATAASMRHLLASAHSAAWPAGVAAAAPALRRKGHVSMGRLVRAYVMCARV